MANVISLHQRQVFLSAGEVAPYAKLYVYQSGTATQVDVFANVGLTTQHSQPIVANADGVFPAAYTAYTEPLRLLATDEDDVALAGYPMDNIVPELASAQDASGVSFDPTEDLPFTNVQDALEGAAALATASEGADLLPRYFTLYTTGGSANAYTLTPSPEVTVYEAGLSFMVMPDRANTGAATLNVNGVGAVDLQKMGSAGTPQALAAGEIQPYREFRVVYDGTRFLLSIGRDFPLRGSNANGEWTKFADGTMECRFSPLTLTFSATSAMAGTWTFPAAFSSTLNMAPTVQLVPETLAAAASTFVASATPTAPEISATVVGSVTTTAMGVRVLRQSGATNFGSNDELFVAVSMKGRWF